MTSDTEHCAALVRDRDLDRYLATLYAPIALRPALFSLHALDLEFAEIVRTTTEPMLGQIRLAWWRDAIEALAGGRSQAHPILRAMATSESRPAGLETFVDAWFPLLDGTADESAAAFIAATGARGAALFELLFDLLEPKETPSFRQASIRAGKGWALAQASRRHRRPELAAAAASALDAAQAEHARVPAVLRPLFALSRLARRDLTHPEERRGGLARQALLLRHIVTGRQ